jgi:hypothetical protein
MPTISTAVPVAVIATSSYLFLKVRASTLVTVNLICEYLTWQLSHCNNKSYHPWPMNSAE